MKQLVNVLVVAALVGLLFVLLNERPSRETIESFQIQGDKIVARIENHKGELGDYPEPKEVQLPEAAHGGWVYKRFSGSFRLHLGDYGEDGFCLSWNQGKGSWYVDT